MTNQVFSLVARGGQPARFPLPSVMGIINCSPHSFYNAFTSVDTLLSEVSAMVEVGAQFIDLGAEPTNPKVDIQAQQPTAEEELAALLPAITAIKQRFDVWVSIDTSQPEVMLAAVEAGADMINDQRALSRPGAVEVVAELGVSVVLMHNFEPIRAPESSTKRALIDSILQDLESAVLRALEAGILPERIIIDPGFGGGNFGKSTAENFYLLHHLSEFTASSYPVLAGLSRKSMIGEALGNAPVADRLHGSVACATIAALAGAAILRVHDVKATQDAVKIVRALKRKS